MTRTAGARIGCQRPSRFWGLGCPKIYHEVEDTLDAMTDRAITLNQLFSSRIFLLIKKRLQVIGCENE
ncbi:hypothetical protein [Thiolapillus sp.]|uniref:hypothetical protein n=1 Tax=Thiolapillus sp. TaxID=2017437 RepID=UPI003AF8FFBE